MKEIALLIVTAIIMTTVFWYAVAMTRVASFSDKKMRELFEQYLEKKKSGGFKDEFKRTRWTQGNQNTAGG